MNKLQAAMRDKSAKKWTEAKQWYKVGSAFKGCNNCGTTNDKGMFVTGTDVVRSYKPKDKGWTYRCLTCGATDDRCWLNAWDIGEEPRIIPRSEISPYRGEAGQGAKFPTLGQYRKARSEEAFPRETVARHSRLSARELAIMQLEARLAQLTAMLAEQGGGR